MKERQLQKLAARMGDQLEADERLMFGVTGQTGMSALAGGLGLIGMLTGKVKARVVLASDRNLYVYSVVRPKGLQAKHPLGSVPVEYLDGRSPALLVGTEKIWVALAGKEDARKLAEHAAAPSTSDGLAGPPGEPSPGQS